MLQPDAVLQSSMEHAATVSCYVDIVLLLLLLLHCSPLLPRMKASPYLFFSCPFTYSCKTQHSILKLSVLLLANSVLRHTEHVLKLPKHVALQGMIQPNAAGRAIDCA
jgi:hypothetical protein